jgi:hypothetical protein
VPVPVLGVFLFTLFTILETDFERYEIKHTSSTGVTFCLKEFRAILTFADAFAMPISASFDDSGQ